MQIRQVLIIVGLVILGGAIYFWWNQNSFSKGDVILEILAPDSLEFGKEFEYLVKVKNLSNFELEDVNLRFEYPESFDFPSEVNISRKIEVIYPKQELTFTFPAIALGELGSKHQALVWLSFRPKGLKSLFTLESSKISLIESLPFNLEIDLPSKVSIGNQVSFNINYFSNADYLLDDVRIQIEYPANFELIAIKPASLDKSEWKVGPLSKAEGGRINIVGIFRGRSGEKRVVKARAIFWKGDKAIELKRVSKITELSSPEIFIFQEINGNPKYIAEPGDLLHYKIKFKNIGRSALKDLFLIVKLEGEAFDFNTLKSEKGRFKLGDNTLIFDSRDLPQLAYLEPQEEGEVEFWIELKDKWEMKSPQDKDHFVKNEVIVSHSREEFITKIGAKVEFQQKGFYQDEVFGNQGPIPPKVGVPTTYTIIWQIKTLFSDLKDVKVRAKLPPFVEFTGKTFPQKVNIVFDSESKELIWDVGKVPAGTGYFENLKPLSLAFQVKLLPTKDLDGKIAPLILSTSLEGEDTWTGKRVEVKLGSLDTSLQGSENLPEEKAKVQNNI